MRKLLRKIGAILTSLRVWTLNLLTLAVLVALVAALLQQRPEPVDPEGKLLILAPEGTIVDQEVYPTEFSNPFAVPTSRQVQARDLTTLIRAAAEDERLAGVLLDFSDAGFAGFGTALNIADEIAALRATGKPVIAYSEHLTTGSYLMAAQANEVYVHPSGAVALSGLGGYRSYIREFTEKLKITIHNYSQGDYKSATEGLTRNDMSEPDRHQREQLIVPVWAKIKEKIAEARGLQPELLQTMADQHPAALFQEAGYNNLAYAEAHGLIDGTRSYPEFRADMIERFGKSDREGQDTYPHISAEAYFDQLEPEAEHSGAAVAVVFLQGVIQEGATAPGTAGGHDTARLIRRAYEHEDTRALVLRVNSPGGAIMASDLIRDELEAARSRDIPVYVSMGDVAASGGVWVSTPAHRIFAEPVTITGSIGVAVAFGTLENVFDYAGIHSDGVTTSKYAGWGIEQGVDAGLDAIFAQWASSAYQHFIDQVASDRERDAEYIRSIAGGRVWLAPRALELGLIDELGGLEDTIEAVAGAAELVDYRINYVTQEPSLGVQLLQRFSVYLGLHAESAYGRFSARLASLLKMLEDISQPTATVLCTDCLLEVP